MLQLIDQELLQELAQHEPQWMLAARYKALQLTQQLEMPSFKYGLRIRLHPKQLLDFALNKEHFVGKHTVDITASDDVVVKRFDEAEELKQYLFSVVNPATNLFTAVHAACRTLGVLFIIPENKKGKITLVFNGDAAAHFDHVIIVGEKNSNADINIVVPETHGGRLRHEIIEVMAKENARLSITTVQQLPAGINIVTRRAHVERDANVSWMDGCFGADFVTGTVQSVLLGEGASTDNIGLFYGDNKQVYDLTAEAYHCAPHTVSNLFTKGAVAGNAKSVYKGLIDIAPDAQHCDGYQKLEGLLLSRKAEMHAVPDLKINTNEVKCSHGATIRQLHDDQLFYLRSRGLSKEEAVKMLVIGFFEPLLAKNASLRKSLMERVSC